MIGFKEKGEAIRTYALDRMTDMRIMRDYFDMLKQILIRMIISAI